MTTPRDDSLPQYLSLHQAAERLSDNRLCVPLRSCVFRSVHGMVKLVRGEKCIVPNAELRADLRNAGIIL